MAHDDIRVRRVTPADAPDLERFYAELSSELGEGVEELAVAVDDRVQHHGVGTLPVAAGLASARLRDVRRPVAWVRAENVAMRHLLVASRHPLHLAWEGCIACYELDGPPSPSIHAAA